MRSGFIAAAILWVMSQGAVAAQEVANNSRFGDWIVNCQAVTTNQTACRLIQTISRQQDQSLVARFVAVPGTNGSTLLAAQVPMGVHLPGGAVFRPEGSEDSQQRKMVWQKCLGQICEAAIVLNEQDLAEFSDAGTILFGYRMDVNADPIVVRVSVSQFAAGIAAITPEKSQ